jgi:hypothetical protein
MARLRAPFQEAGAEHAPYLNFGTGKEGKEGPPGKEGKEGPAGPEGKEGKEGKEPTGAVLLAGRAGGQLIEGEPSAGSPSLNLFEDAEHVARLTVKGVLTVPSGQELEVQPGGALVIPEGAGEGKALVSGPGDKAEWAESFKLKSIELLLLTVETWAKISQLFTMRRAQLGGSLFLTTFTPREIKANQNNYRAGSEGPAEEVLFPAAIIRLKSSAEFNITGLAKQPAYEEPVTGEKADGQILILTNIGAFTLNLVNESALSTASNRILTSTGANLKLEPKHSIRLYYDEATAKWRDW